MAIFLLASVGRVLAWLLLILGATISAQASMLDVPFPNTTLSGIGVIHGWKCTAGQLTVRFNDGPPLSLLYGAQRIDVQRARQCTHGHANVGFVSIMNWSELGDGTHTAVVYDDGVEFARSTFHVMTLGQPFHTGTGTCRVEDFPAFNQQAQFLWNPSTQHMELLGVTQMPEEEEALIGVTDTDLTPFEFLFERNALHAWIIEVTDGDRWSMTKWKQNISSTVDQSLEGDRLVPAPARVEFTRPKQVAGDKMPWEPHYKPAVAGAKISGWLYGRWDNRPGPQRIFSLGGVLDMLPEQTAWQLGVMEQTYALVISVPGSTYEDIPNRCYLLIFDQVQRTATGGLDMPAYFAVTEKAPNTKEVLPNGQHLSIPGACRPPVSPLSTVRMKLY